jgi:hypothetical protein
MLARLFIASVTAFSLHKVERENIFGAMSIGLKTKKATTKHKTFVCTPQ